MVADGIEAVALGDAARVDPVDRQCLHVYSVFVPQALLYAAAQPAYHQKVIVVVIDACTTCFFQKGCYYHNQAPV